MPPLQVAPDETLRVLLVDNHVDTATSTAALLELEGYDTCTLTDPRLVARVAASFRPHVLVSNLLMPRPSGCDVARMFREDVALAGVRRLAYTGVTDSAVIEEAKQAGFEHVILKPRVDDLLDWLRKRVPPVSN